MNIARTVTTSALRLAFAGLLSASASAFAQPLFQDGFDVGLTAGTLPNWGTYEYFGNGLMSVDVVTTDYVSGPNAVALSVDFSGANASSWGVMLTRQIYYNPTLDSIDPVDATNAVISFDLKSSADLSANTAMIAFRLGNADGSVLVRSSQAQYFNVGTEFQTYSIAASALSFYDAGSNFDLTTVKQVSVLIYNLGENLATTFTIDNIAITNVSNVPEPSAFAALTGVGVLGLVALRRRRRAV